MRETKVASEPEVLISWFRGLGFTVAWIGEAGPLSQWLYAGCGAAGRITRDPVHALALQTAGVILTHTLDAFKAMPVKTDRKDPRNITQ